MNKNDLIYQYAKQGKKLADIARMFKLSRERIRQIVKQHKPI